MRIFSKEEIKINSQLFIRKIGNILQSPQSREFLIFLFFVLIASTFWIIQALNENYETEFSVPLKVKNLPENVIVTSEIPKALHFTVKDKGTVLVNYMLGQDFLPITVDFAEYAQRGSFVRIPASDLEKKLLGQLAVSTSLEALKPDTLELIYTVGKAKKVPVVVSGAAFAAKQYYIAGKQLSPDSVMVYAPQEVIDTLSKAYTEPVRLEEVNDTAHVRLSLQSVRGAKFIPNTVDAYFYADMFTEKTVEVPIVGIGFPKDKQLKTFPARVEVTFHVGFNRFKSIQADDFRIEVYYSELQNKHPEQCTLHLSKVPTGVSYVRLSFERVDYLIEQVVTDDK